MKRLPLLTLLILVFACSVHDDAKPPDQPTLVGSWRHASYVVSNCTDPADERNDPCTGTAAECGVLTLTETTWTWVQTLPDGSQETEGGSFTVSGNYFILSGGSAPGTKMYSVSGSIFSYTKTTLTFINTSISTGCTHTVTYSRHVQPITPTG